MGTGAGLASQQDQNGEAGREGRAHAEFLSIWGDRAVSVV
ncbi:hypothetical protein BN2497_1291 [Janthinobacterium sp. CG23_2]|nr:hypothetical protein BN2497_1291 [Janthinobacterium sp. CG23_2]CUU27043.1 hypothetical protein BN3177_1291 [Janthinobacterium sp. CG23_2]